MRECKHKRIKLNFPHGRKSGAKKSCKDCGAIVSNHEISKRIRELKKRSKYGNRNQRRDT